MLQKLSPFSTLKKYKIRWQQSNRSVDLNVELNPKKKKALESLSVLRFSTKLQLAKQMNRNLRKGKQNVNMLRDRGLIIEHHLISKKQGIPFYSISPMLANYMNIQPPSRMDVNDVLRRLLVSQFYVRFYELDETVKVLDFPEPFDAAFTLLEKNDFRIAVVRGNPHPIIQHLKYHPDEKMKTLIVVETLNFAKPFLEMPPEAPFRITTDHHLLKEDLSQSFFYNANQKEWVQSEIPLFKEREKELAVQTD